MRRPDLHDLAQRIDAPIVTRFAPSPTGYLHIGAAAAAGLIDGIAPIEAKAVRDLFD